MKSIQIILLMAIIFFTGVSYAQDSSSEIIKRVEINNPIKIDNFLSSQRTDDCLEKIANHSRIRIVKMMGLRLVQVDSLVWAHHDLIAGNGPEGESVVHNLGTTYSSGLELHFIDDDGSIKIRLKCKFKIKK